LISGSSRGYFWQALIAPEARKKRSCQSLSASHIAPREDCPLHRPAFFRPDRPEVLTVRTLVRSVNTKKRPKADNFPVRFLASLVNKRFISRLKMLRKNATITDSVEKNLKLQARNSARRLLNKTEEKESQKKEKENLLGRYQSKFFQNRKP